MIRKLQAGSLDAIEQVMEQYTPYLITVIRRQFGDYGTPEDVDEVCSDVITALWQGRKELHTNNLRRWLATVARNKVINRLRREKLNTVPMEDVILVADESAESHLDAIEQDRILCLALAELDDSDRDIFHRYYYYNQTVAEIAKEKSMKETTVKVRLHRGREKLRNFLIREGYEL